MEKNNGIAKHFQYYTLAKNNRRVFILATVGFVVFVYIFFLLYNATIPIEILDKLGVQFQFSAYIITIIALDLVVTLLLIWFCIDWVYVPLDEENAHVRLEKFLSTLEDKNKLDTV